MTEEEAIRLFSLAATIIQAHVRGYLVRKKFDFCQYRRRNYAAASIQAVWYKNSLISFWSIILNPLPFLFPTVSFPFPSLPFSSPTCPFFAPYLPLPPLSFLLPSNSLFPDGNPCLHFLPFLFFPLSLPFIPLSFPFHPILSHRFPFLLLTFLPFHIRPLPFLYLPFLPITSSSFPICSLQSSLPLTGN